MPTIVKTAEEYFQLLCKKSRDGEFPAKKPDKQRPNSSRCCYRAPGGRECAVGCIMPNSVYRKWMDDPKLAPKNQEQARFAEIPSETTTFKDIARFVNDLSWIPDGMTPMDLTVVQSCHDRNALPDWTTIMSDEWNHELFVQALKDRVAQFANFEENPNA
jgi:hypothetical protein